MFEGQVGHEEEFENDHGGGHDAGHIELVEVREDVIQPIDHGIHQEVHEEKVKGSHDE